MKNCDRCKLVEPEHLYRCLICSSDICFDCRIIISSADFVRLFLCRECNQRGGQHLALFDTFIRQAESVIWEWRTEDRAKRPGQQKRAHGR